ncbi:MAG: gamma-glutamylcyclotransferase [Planctomycetota bacterium]|nr:gamma-glutamylcyclotransferase [Planctomycetota bacterium]
MTDEVRFYFAYGSNADPERFRGRVGRWRSCRPAWLDGHVLRFAEAVRSEGGGGAIVVPREGGTVAGVLFEITTEQLAAMDREEFDASHDATGIGRRERWVVRTDTGSVEAEIYTLAIEGGRLPPSERYLSHILDGLRAAGHSEATLEAVRSIAAATA